MGPFYIVTERFGPGRGVEWGRYVTWSGLTQLTEVVSLDSTLCPPVVGEILDEDWPHIVNENFMLNYFVDLDYLLQRAGDPVGKNLLCVFRNPVAHPSPPTGSYRFDFEGYDLVGVRGGQSALSNCGGFPRAFSSSELSRHGLLSTLDRANEVGRALCDEYPTEPRARCHVWAIYRAADA